MTEAEKPQATSDEAFLAIMQQSWPEGRPPDGDLVGAAQRVCEAAGAGAPVDEIVVIDDVHNNDVVIAAMSVYCPQ
ncbi:hypothetical protein GCM10017602_01010 [Herbiconiux flava]|nr:hypothetical protein GCM10017602_01010 [Herbiconiux flava]